MSETAETPDAIPGVEARRCLTVYHDGSCPLCQREIAVVKSLHGTADISFADVSQLGPDQQPADDLTARDAMARFHVRRADGTLLSGAAAFIEMWSFSPRLRRLGSLGKSPFAVRMLDSVYGGFLRVRPVLAKALRRYDGWRKT